MKRILQLSAAIYCLGIFFSTETFACIGSNCRPCPVGFSVTKKCCKEGNKDDCVLIGKDIEKCGHGKWSEYPHSFRIKHNDYCCKDENENNCRGGGHYERYCGEGELAEYPYSPVKKCCKDETESDCVIIRAKGYCGRYQLEDYPVWEADCCDSLLEECTGHVEDCPRCL